MNVEDLKSIDQLEQFLEGTRAVVFEVMSSKDERYQWIQRKLVKHRYLTLSKHDRGVVIRFLGKVTGYSRQQLTRLIKQYRDKGRLVRQQKTENGFKRRYQPADVMLLAGLDERHGTLNGATTKKLCERAFDVYGDQAYETLSGISVSHLYNLRKTFAYRNHRQTFEKTRSKPSRIGERRKPQPDGQPGFIRIDTVHQGDLDGQKGVYHINAVDEETQFEIVCSVEKISEHYLLPVLACLLMAFPFIIRGFHSDNGSEYINKQVAKLLKKLWIDFTKSRSRQSNDNALVESKNGAIVRKILGYSHIPQHYAAQVNAFNQDFLNPYINFHRPCFFAEIIIDSKGKQRKRYPYSKLMTPYEKLKSLEGAARFLKPDVTFEQLDKVAYGMSDDEAADRLQKARRGLFRSISDQEKLRG